MRRSYDGSPECAFGVDPVRPQRYSLRQSRYDALAQDISDWAGSASTDKKLQVLIIGCGTGTELRHLRGKPHFDKLALFGANIDALSIYGRECYDELYFGDLAEGYPDVKSNFYDVVVCEQVLEHLTRIDIAIATFERALKPGGRLIVGVPTFPPPLHLVRKYLVPKIDQLLAPMRQRGHVQAFSLSTLLAAIRTHSRLDLLQVRGFRVISGGALVTLENHRWWWKFNRRLGEMIPSLCIEVQAILEKRRDANGADVAIGAGDQQAAARRPRN